MDIFEKASRTKIRFPSTRGDLTVEQLWDLPLQSKTQFDLDTIAKSINREVKATSEESFVSEASATSAKLTLSLDIVKYIISVKLKENQDNLNRASKIAERDKLLNILADKQDSALKELTPDQIQKRLTELAV